MKLYLLSSIMTIQLLQLSTFSIEASRHRNPIGGSLPIANSQKFPAKACIFSSRNRTCWKPNHVYQRHHYPSRTVATKKNPNHKLALLEFSVWALAQRLIGFQTFCFRSVWVNLAAKLVELEKTRPHRNAGHEYTPEI